VNKVVAPSYAALRNWKLKPNFLALSTCQAQSNDLSSLVSYILTWQTTAYIYVPRHSIKKYKYYITTTAYIYVPWLSIKNTSTTVLLIDQHLQGWKHFVLLIICKQFYSGNKSGIFHISFTDTT
jgi:hypothetical protein